MQRRRGVNAGERSANIVGGTADLFEAIEMMRLSNASLQNQMLATVEGLLAEEIARIWPESDVLARRLTVRQSLPFFR